MFHGTFKLTIAIAVFGSLFLSFATDNLDAQQTNGFIIYQEQQERPGLEIDSGVQDRPIEPAMSQPTQDRFQSSNMSQWPARSIRQINLSLDDQAQRTPNDRSDELVGFGRVGDLVANPKLFAWEAPNIRYQPLYFEDVRA